MGQAWPSIGNAQSLPHSSSQSELCSGHQRNRASREPRVGSHLRAEGLEGFPEEVIFGLRPKDLVGAVRARKEEW